MKIPLAHGDFGILFLGLGILITIIVISIFISGFLKFILIKKLYNKSFQQKTGYLIFYKYAFYEILATGILNTIYQEIFFGDSILTYEYLSFWKKIPLYCLSYLIYFSFARLLIEKLNLLNNQFKSKSNYYLILIFSILNFIAVLGLTAFLSFLGSKLLKV